MFVVLCNVDSVGAATRRPMVSCYEFAENQCEYVILCRRATIGRPYIHNRNGTIN